MIASNMSVSQRPSFRFRILTSRESHTAVASHRTVTPQNHSDSDISTCDRPPSNSSSRTKVVYPCMIYGFAQTAGRAREQARTRNSNLVRKRTPRFLQITSQRCWTCRDGLRVWFSCEWVCVDCEPVAYEDLNSFQNPARDNLYPAESAASSKQSK
jgi:hypothetical protein